MRRPFKHWQVNRRYTGFSLGQMLAIYVLAFGLRHGMTETELRPHVDQLFGRLPAWLRSDMLISAQIVARSYVLGGEGTER